MSIKGNSAIFRVCLGMIKKKIHMLYFKPCCEGMLSRFSHIQLFVTLWTVAHQAPLSMRFSRQEYWSGLPFLSSGDLPDPGIKPRSPALWADSLPPEPPGKPYVYNIVSVSAIKQSEAVRHTHTHTHTDICICTSLDIFLM